METFHTSYCQPLNLSVKAEERGLRFRDIPYGSAFDHILVRIVAGDGREVLSGNVSRDDNTYLSTGSLPDGEYTLEVYSPTGAPGRFRGFIHDEDASVRVRGGRPSFCEPWPYRENLSILQRYSRSPETVRALLRNEEAYPCGAPEIRRIAAVISTDITDVYRKMLAVHDWVAENVFYDKDSLRIVNGTLATVKRPTLDVLMRRRAVCQGYSDLAVALLRACGIPAVSVNCFALGQGTGGGWESAENRVNRSNHAFTAALLDNRYVLMDVTWDSDLVYAGGRYGRKTGCGMTRKYFDMSPMLLSASHRLIV